MSPQRSNRARLVEGTLRCLERLPPEQVTARAIAEESGANPASINYHFGSKDLLVVEAVIEGLDRWLAEVAARLDEVVARGPRERFERAAEVLRGGGRRTGLARNYVAALAKAQHNERIQHRLAEGIRRTRPRLATVLELGEDEVGEDAAALVLAMFHGLLLHSLLDSELDVGADRMLRAQSRLGAVLSGLDPHRHAF